MKATLEIWLKVRLMAWLKIWLSTWLDAGREGRLVAVIERTMTALSAFRRVMPAFRCAAQRN
jgi:hypothetical protein